jgi:RimJ/RimL family protein N-acetyltransferase
MAQVALFSVINWPCFQLTKTKLWVNHLFANSEYHKLCLDTWSFNPRMMRVAEKAGFLYEGRQREIQYWQGEWLDLMHYGMLREEWEHMR